jgi:hypothetical protein
MSNPFENYNDVDTARGFHRMEDDIANAARDGDRFQPLTAHWFEKTVVVDIDDMKKSLEPHGKFLDWLIARDAEASQSQSSGESEA